MFERFIKALIACLVCLQPLFGFMLKERLNRAEAQDFIVYAYRSSFTLLTIKKISDDSITLEEITAALVQKPESFQKWLLEGAPGHTSWTTYVIDKKTFAIINTQAKDDVEMHETPPILPKLIALELTPIALHDRKKVGPEPLAGEVDLRPIWTPKIIFNGKEVAAQVSGYTLVWPKDESELSGKKVEVYVPDTAALSYLPYWVEVLSGPVKFKVFAIDSGKNLPQKL